MSSTDLSVDLTSGAELNGQHRLRIIRDIASLKHERHREDNEFNLQNCVNDLRDHHTDALPEIWLETVGQWALQHDDTEIPPNVSEEEWLRYQFGQLLMGNDTEYGFVVTAHSVI